MVGRLGVNTKCVCFSCQEAWKVLCRSSARAGQGKSPSQHPLSAVERQSGQSCELPAWCFQASGALIQDLWSCTASSRCRSVLLHSIKSTGVLENGSFLHGNSSVWHGPWRGTGPWGVPVGAVGTGMFSPRSLPRCCLALSSISCFEAMWAPCVFQAGKEGSIRIHSGEGTIHS